MHFYNQREILTEDSYQNVEWDLWSREKYSQRTCTRTLSEWELWIREKYSQKTCTRTLSESYESERKTHRGLVLGRWVIAMNQGEILTDNLYLDVEWELCESERNTHRGLVLGRWARVIWIREKYSQRTCTIYRTLGASAESKRNTHRWLVLGRWVRALCIREKYSQRTCTWTLC